MKNLSLQAVTGAFGYTGKYIARRLLDKGHKVITLTNSPYRSNPFGDKVPAFPFNFDSPEKLTETLKNVEVLYNTYWVRFNHRLFTYDKAVHNTLEMFKAAKEAGVKRIVHISITNPSNETNLEYFRGKAKIEQALMESGITYAILRPTVLFGKEDILLNNIAWGLRRLPIFGVFGNGQYRLQPIYVDDLAEQAVKLAEKRDNIIIDAIGPETFTYKELVEKIGQIIGKKRHIISVPPWLGYFVSKIIGNIVNDIIITKDEIEGLMKGLLYVNSPPVGKIKLTDWVKQHRDSLGLHYTSEMSRRKNRKIEYKSN